MPTKRDQGTVSQATTSSPLELGLKMSGDWNRVGCWHTMSNHYELPRAPGPQRHISSKVALCIKIVAALKFSSVHCFETQHMAPFSGILYNGLYC